MKVFLLEILCLLTKIIVKLSIRIYRSLLLLSLLLRILGSCFLILLSPIRLLLLFYQNPIIFLSLIFI